MKGLLLLLLVFIVLLHVDARLLTALKHKIPVQPTALTCLVKDGDDTITTYDPDLIKWEKICRQQKAWLTAIDVFYGLRKQDQDEKVTENDLIVREKWLKSLEGLMNSVPIPDTYNIDQDAVEKYLSFFEDKTLQAQVKDYIQLASTNAKHIDTMKKDLMTCLKKAELHKKKNVYVWLPPEKNKLKSQPWIMALAFSELYGSIDKVPISIKGFFSSQDDFSTAIDGDVTVVFFDDMSYSGNQLAQDIKKYSPPVTKKKKITKIVVVPYVTVSSKKMLKDTKAKIFAVNMKNPLKPISDTMKKALEAIYIVGSYAVWLDNKIADEISIAQWVMSGELRDKILNAEGKQYVQTTNEKFIPLFKGCENFPSKSQICPTEAYKGRLVGMLSKTDLKQATSFVLK